jgi:hypothetical protein
MQSFLEKFSGPIPGKIILPVSGKPVLPSDSALGREWLSYLVQKGYIESAQKAFNANSNTPTNGYPISFTRAKGFLSREPWKTYGLEVSSSSALDENGRPTVNGHMVTLRMGEQGQVYVTDTNSPEKKEIPVVVTENGTTFSVTYYKNFGYAYQLERLTEIGLPPYDILSKAFPSKGLETVTRTEVASHKTGSETLLQSVTAASTPQPH